ncbi:hypothetical protein HZH66_003017 [Vespula vulgaris]|uniref:Uncharacterized protein n=1 Tax=Vespula vulgaris TaxID=7454 RepID=A0A834NFR4_VESVU|nr:hypothetical protein HZH66_003017 [Vespula vulgaris]
MIEHEEAKVEEVEEMEEVEEEEEEEGEKGKRKGMPIGTNERTEGRKAEGESIRSLLNLKYSEEEKKERHMQRIKKEEEEEREGEGEEKEVKEETESSDVAPCRPSSLLPYVTSYVSESTVYDPIVRFDVGS